MSRRESSYGARLIEDMEIRRAALRAAGNPRQHPSLTRRWSESDDEYDARVHDGHPRPAESRQDGVNQATTWIPGYNTDDYGAPWVPPPPYSERDRDLGGGEMLPNHHFNLYPGGGRRAD